MVINTNNDVASKASTHSGNRLNHSPSPEKKAPEGSTQSNTRDQVQLSNEAQTFKRLEAKIQDSEGVNSARVEELKQQLADGSYTINNDSIAEKLLQQDGSFE